MENSVIDELTVHSLGVDFVAGVPVIARMQNSQKPDFFAVIDLVGKLGSKAGFLPGSCGILVVSRSIVSSVVVVRTS